MEAQGAQPPKYVSPAATWRTKLALRILSATFVVVIAGLGGSLLANGLSSLYIVVLLIPAVIVTFIWDVAECISIWFRGGRRGIHPGAVVAIDLIAWLGWIIVAFGMVPISTNPQYYIQGFGGYDTYYRYSSSSSKITDADRKLLNDVRLRGRVLLAFVSFVAITHFVLFVIACQETHTRNRMARVVYVMQPVYGPPSMMVPGAYQQLQPMPMQPQQGQPQQWQPQYQQFMQPANQLPTQPAPAHAAETKGGPERYA